VLTDARLRKRYEHQLGVLIAEGPNVVRELIARRTRPGRCWSRPSRRTGSPEETAHLDVPSTSSSGTCSTRSCGSSSTRACSPAAVGCPPVARRGARAARTVAVLEGLNDHENLGTLFRSARGLGVDAVLLAPGCADPLYRRSVRVSMGHVLHVPVHPDRAAGQLADELHERGFATVALTPRADAVELAAVTRPAERVAVLLGAEGPGLSAEAIEGATHAVRIAMDDGVDSLNVAAAGAIAFHALRA
jgi:tRNA G18 (ribose-2'-O)-methylase SpoU